MEFHPLAVSSGELAKSSTPAPSSAEPAAQESKPWLKHPGITKRVPGAKKFSQLSDAQLAAYDHDGYLLIRAEDVWTAEEKAELLKAAEDLDNWPDQKFKWMKYYEPNRHDPTGPKILQRIENFTDYSPVLNKHLSQGKLSAMCSDLFGEECIMYKEKVNFKLPGGAGFQPHQDVAAGWWMYKQSIHVSCLVSIDASTLANGCLEVVSGEHTRGMLSPEWKEIPAETCAQLDWKPVETKPGDVLFFDSYVPHKSDVNNTQLPRRVLYVTYAKAAEGDFRARYYSDKRASFPPDIEREPGKEYAYKI